MSTPTPTSSLSFPTSTLPYPISVVGYVKLGKDERCGGVVLGKTRFNKDIPLCYHEISLQFIQSYAYFTCRSNIKFTLILKCVCL